MSRDPEEEPVVVVVVVVSGWAENASESGLELGAFPGKESESWAPNDQPLGTSEGECGMA